MGARPRRLDGTGPGAAAWRRRVQSSLIVFASTPTLSISISTLSPGFIHTGGVRREPTPPGVPVTITSPGDELGEGRDVVDQPWDLEDHHLGRRALHLGPVQARDEREHRAGRDLVSGDHPRAERTGAREVLPGGPLHRVPLVVADRAVVVAGVAGDVPPGLRFRDAPAAGADDHRDLAFVVEHLRFARPRQRLLVPDLRAGHSQEERRVLGLVAVRFDPMLLVVEADADDLVGIGDHREVGERVEARVGFLAGGRPLRLVQRVRRDKRPQIGVLGADPAAEVHDAAPFDRAVARPAVEQVARELHFPLLYT